MLQLPHDVVGTKGAIHKNARLCDHRVNTPHDRLLYA